MNYDIAERLCAKQMIDFFAGRAFYVDKHPLSIFLLKIMSGTIGTDPLFLGLTRPPMILGVSYTFAALNAMISLLAFVITNKFFYLLVLLPTSHMMAWFVCLKEPRALELLLAKTSKCNVCANRYHHGGTNSYDSY